MPLLIVIPTLNEASNLPKLLDDLTAQDYKDFSCVIADGGSKDATEVIARRYSENDPRFSLIRCGVANVSTQRNLGARYGDGSSECILFLDADSRVRRSFLSDLLSQWRLEWVAATVAAVPDTTRISDRFFLSLQNILYRILAFFGRPYCWGACMVVRRDIFFKVHGFDETITHMEDSELVQRVCTATTTRFIVLSHPQFTFSMRRYRGQSKLLHILKLIPTFFRSFFSQQFSTSEALYPMRSPPHRRNMPSGGQSE